jgi:hypothetical protein
VLVTCLWIQKFESLRSSKERRDPLFNEKMPEVKQELKDRIISSAIDEINRDPVVHT